jgi:hypothetical protein
MKKLIIATMALYSFAVAPPALGKLPYSIPFTQETIEEKVALPKQQKTPRLLSQIWEDGLHVLEPYVPDHVEDLIDEMAYNHIPALAKQKIYSTPNEETMRTIDSIGKQYKDLEVHVKQTYRIKEKYDFKPDFLWKEEKKIGYRIFKSIDQYIKKKRGEKIEKSKYEENIEMARSVDKALSFQLYALLKQMRKPGNSYIQSAHLISSFNVFLEYRMEKLQHIKTVGIEQCTPKDLSLEFSQKRLY